MIAETGNTYTPETTRDIIKIPKAKMGFTTVDRSKKVSAGVCNSD